MLLYCFLVILRPPKSTLTYPLFPLTMLFRSSRAPAQAAGAMWRASCRAWPLSRIPRGSRRRRGVSPIASPSAACAAPPIHHNNHKPEPARQRERAIMPRGKKAVSPVLPENENDSAGAIAPSVIQSIALGRLMRAPENVRQTNKAVDVESLADDIAAHGLLQSLIGYAGDTDIDAAAVYIVGGGRRLQALQLLR